jgi:two-component system OmpR family response regulator
MEAVSAPRVLCVSEEFNTRRQICGHLATEGFAVLVEAPPLDLLDCLDSYRPDLLLADLADVDLAALVDIRERFPSIALIGLANSALAGDQIRGLWHLGIADLFFAPVDFAELSSSIRVALNRAPSGSFGIDDILIDEAGHFVTRAGQEIELTSTEFKLLVNLVTNAGIVMSKRQLLNNVWGFDDYDENLVEVYVSGLRRKLEALGPRLIHTVRGVGYVVRDPVWARPERQTVAG